MITVKRLSYAVCCAVLCIGLGAAIGRAQETADDYVALSQAVPKGKAPAMQIQLLSRGGQTEEYAVIFGEGDEAFSGLLEFAQKYRVTSAHFTAIGGLSSGTLAWYDPQRKMFKKIPIDGQVEVASMIGDIALYQGRPVVHSHMVVASANGSTIGGHVLAAFVSPTLEVMVTVDPIAMQKRLDPENGLTLIDPALR
ncbi:MAG: PPC domain-containing DNA-binding protein [Candidatus Binataceae bacterium]|jgi:predicted DNA-binding protein with PD1-like motif